MRIGLVLDRFEPALGGREHWTLRFAEALAAGGHEVHAISGEFGQKVLTLPAVLHRVHCGKSLLAFGEAARAVLEPLALDIIHDMGSGWYCDVFQPHGGSWASALHRKLLLLPPWLRWLKLHAHGLLPRYRTFQKLARRQYADHGQIILAMSRSGAEDLQRFHGVAPQRIRIVHNGIDSQRFSPERCAPHRAATRHRLGIGPKTVLALLVAHNLRLKGLPTLLQATARLKAEGHDVHLVVVGGKRLGSWQRHAEQLGIGGIVSFVGLVDDPLPFYAAADLYVHPTYYDHCSLVVLEAAACGLPVVTSRYNGVTDLLHEGRDVLLISDPADSGELAAAMSRLLDASTRQALGAAARQTACQFTFGHNVEQILAIYEEVLKSRGDGGKRRRGEDFEKSPGTASRG